MMDYAYICRSGENEELRYSIRSLVKNTANPNIFLFGQAPSWYSGNIELIKERGTKYSRARTNLTAITKSSDVQEEFVLMNDDFFIMQRTTIPPVWHGGLFSDKVAERKTRDPNTPYFAKLLETQKTLKSLGIKDPLDYELHTPLQITKSGLAEALKYPGLWRSIYGNLNQIGGEYHEDVKIYPEGFAVPSYDWKKKSLYLSTMDEAFEGPAGRMIRNKLSKKTIYENN